MKTRIFYTKFWTDSYILSLSPLERLLYSFYISNENVGMTGIYEIAPQIIQLSTGLTSSQIQKAKEKFVADGKMNFHKDWVMIRNFDKYQSYNGEKNQIAMEREKSLIPKDILDILLAYTMDGLFPTEDSPINHKTEILNKNIKLGEIKESAEREKRGLDDLTEDDVGQIAIDYHVPVSFVMSKIDDIRNYCASKGKKYRDYKATLRNWVKKDALERKEVHNGKSRLTVIRPDPAWDTS